MIYGKPMKILILAGGFATRLWPLTENKAKPLLHLKDRPLISHLVDGLPKDSEVIISTNAIFENDFKEWAKGFSDRPITVFVEDSASDEQKKGALGAVAHVIESLGISEDLMVMAGDNYFGFAMTDFLAAYQGNPLLAAYDLKDRDAARKFGVVVAQNGQAVEFQEKPELPKSTLVSTGCYIFPAGTLGDIQTYAKTHNDNLGGIFEYLLTLGKTVEVFTFEEPWFDIGSFEAYMDANRHLIGDQVIQKEGVTLEGKNQFLGSVYLGPNVTVKNSTLENVVVLDDGMIDNCVIRNSVIDAGCDLKGIDLERKMIRQNSVISK